jgi:uncharacterized protein
MRFAAASSGGIRRALVRADEDVLVVNWFFHNRLVCEDTECRLYSVQMSEPPAPLNLTFYICFMNILITGASGLIGSHLTDLLLKHNYAVGHLVRNVAVDKRVKHFQWNPAAGKIDPEAIRWADAIINLAGAGIADKRWTEERKRLIIDSRVQSVRLLAKEAKTQQKELTSFITASGVGYYGMDLSEKIFREEDPPGTDLAAECCRLWEQAADLFEELGSRVVKLRIGVVLANDGGALPRLAAPIKLYAGAAIAPGNQWMRWVHIDDVCRAFLKAIEDDSMNGAYNVVATNDATNKDFTKAVAKKLGKPVLLPPIPEFVMRLMFGKMSRLLTTGTRASNQKIRQTGFDFEYEKLSAALDALMRKRY